MKNFTEDELEDFLEQVEDVNKKVKDIIDGKIELEQLDKDEAARDVINKAKVEIKQREKDDLLKKGRPGKGNQRGYKRFCKFCFTEYMIDIEKCTHCSKETMTEEDRYAELKDKLEEYKTRQMRKKEKKAKWENWKKTQALFYKKTSTNYKKWEFFESSSDSDKDEQDPILPRNDPNFRAMESEMMDRKKRRARDKKEAEALKVKGNEALKRGLYKTAQKHYTDALEIKRDLLPLYTNRALVRLKLEDFTGVIDDCTRILEYCDVFHDGFLHERDLCYKAFMRRCQALRGQKDYELALKDLEEAAKLFPGDKDVERLTKLTLEDIEVEKNIKSIMSNAQLLNGKEYLDFILEFLQGKKGAAVDSKVKKYCYHEISDEEIKKIAEPLQNKEVVQYFNVKDGFKTLVGSLEYNTNALDLIQKLLENDQKLIEDFQKQKLYEQLIDFLYNSNQNVEGKTLEPIKVHQILEILESASMNDYVRQILSEKKKIKDVFLVVIRSINPQENRKLLSSLVQFISNLCYGTGKFRTMLRTENPSEFLKTIRQVLQTTDQEEQDKSKNGDRLLFKQSLMAFIGNLCVDPTLRSHIASNMEDILSEVFDNFDKDVKDKGFLWVESVNRELGILINVSIDQSGQNFLIDKQTVKILDKLIIGLQYKGEEEEVVSRVINLLSKIARDPKGAQQIADCKNIILRVLLYFNKSFPALIHNSLRVLHSCCKVQNFREICLEKHGFTVQNFDTYVKEVIELFTECNQKQEMDNLVNCCSSVSAFSEVFPERMSEFKSMIIPLITLVKEKLDLVRKNAAVCLAKLSKDEENGRIMRENHGTEVLVSLQNVLK